MRQSYSSWAVLALSVSVSLVVTPKPPPSIAGSWVLHDEGGGNSPFSGRGGPGGRPGGRRPGGGMPGGGGGGGGGGGRYPSRGDEGAFGRIDPTVRELLRPKLRLVIEQQDTMVTVRDDAGWLRYLLVSGKPMREELGQGGPAVVKSSWKKEKLVTERKFDNGGDYRETFRLDPKTSRLQVEIDFRPEGSQQPIVRRETYEREAQPGGD